jgi:hypothetical protein
MALNELLNSENGGYVFISAMTMWGVVAYALHKIGNLRYQSIKLRDVKTRREIVDVVITERMLRERLGSHQCQRINRHMVLANVSKFLGEFGKKVVASDFQILVSRGNEEDVTNYLSVLKELNDYSFADIKHLKQDYNI